MLGAAFVLGAGPLAGLVAAAARVRVPLGFSVVVFVDDAAAVASTAAALAGDVVLAGMKPPLGFKGEVGCER